MGLVWCVSILIPTLLKLILNTTYSIYYCTDGYSKSSITISIVYYVLNTVLGNFVPTAIIFGLYFRLYNRLKKQDDRLQKGVPSVKLTKFAKQFFLINGLTLIVTISSTLIDFVNVIGVDKNL